MLTAILDTLYPPTCLGCGARGTALCRACKRDAGKRVHIERAGLSIVACGRYEGALRRAILRFKRGRRDGAAPLAALLGEAFASDGVPPEILVVPVPTTSANARERGFDQGVALARELARLDDRPIVAALRKRVREHQRGHSRVERLLARGRFEVVAPHLVAHAHVLLIDDVVTTGATLADCALTLTNAGANVAGAFVLAYA
jgi:ComF family protein